MKTFKSFLGEEIRRSTFTYNGSVDIERETVRAEINALLSNASGKPCVTPYAALTRVVKVLSYYHIFLTKKPYLEGDRGVEVFDVAQFGEKMGMNDQGEFVKSMPVKYHIVFRWRMLGGMMFCTAQLLDKVELDKELDNAERELAEAVVPSVKRSSRLARFKTKIATKVKHELGNRDPSKTVTVYNRNDPDKKVKRIPVDRFDPTKHSKV